MATTDEVMDWVQDIATELNDEEYGEIKDINHFTDFIQSVCPKPLSVLDHRNDYAEISIEGARADLVYEEDEWSMASNYFQMQKEADALDAAGLNGLEGLGDTEEEPIDHSDPGDDDDDQEEEDFTEEWYPNEEDKEERHEKLSRDIEKYRDRD